MPADTQLIVNRRKGWLSARMRRHLTVALAVAAVAALIPALNTYVFVDPPFVQHVLIENNSEYDVHVAVGPASGDDVLPLGVATQHCTRDFLKVLDQGSTWTIRLRAQGVDVDPILVRRDDLAASGWRFVIPDSVVTGFRRGGAPASPRQGCASPT